MPLTLNVTTPYSTPWQPPKDASCLNRAPIRLGRSYQLKPFPLLTFSLSPTLISLLLMAQLC